MENIVFGLFLRKRLSNLKFPIKLIIKKVSYEMSTDEILVRYFQGPTTDKNQDIYISQIFCFRLQQFWPFFFQVIQLYNYGKHLYVAAPSHPPTQPSPTPHISSLFGSQIERTNALNMRCLRPIKDCYHLYRIRWLMDSDLILTKKEKRNIYDIIITRLLIAMKSEKMTGNHKS